MKTLLVLLPAKFLQCMSCSNCVILFYEKTILLSVTITLKMKSEVSFFFKPTTLWFQDQSRVVENLIKLSQDQQEFYLSFVTFLFILFLYCLSFSFEFEQSQTTQNISSEKHFYTTKSNTSGNVLSWVSINQL